MPELGRWLRFDPLEEAGGANIYIMLNNDGINLLDEAGLWVKVKPQDPNDFTYCAQKGDTLSKLAKDITGNWQDYVCLWPVSVKNPNRYPDFVSAKDKYNAENLEKNWSVELRLALYAPMTNTLGGTTTPANKVPSEIERVSNQGATPISYMLLQGHANSVVIGGKISKMESYFRVNDYTAYKANSYPVTYERASQKKGPKRCWFARNATVRFMGCNSSLLAKSFAKAALRKGASAYGTKYYIGVGSNILLYASKLQPNLKWFPAGHIQAPKRTNDLFSPEVWASHSGGL